MTTVMETKQQELLDYARGVVTKQCEKDIDFDMLLDIATINREREQFIELVRIETGLTISRVIAGELMFARWLVLNEL